VQPVRLVELAGNRRAVANKVLVLPAGRTSVSVLRGSRSPWPRSSRATTSGVDFPT
jgi:hypothetical protein